MLKNTYTIPQSIHNLLCSLIAQLSINLQLHYLSVQSISTLVPFFSLQHLACLLISSITTQSTHSSLLNSLHHPHTLPHPFGTIHHTGNRTTSLHLHLCFWIFINFHSTSFPHKIHQFSSDSLCFWFILKPVEDSKCPINLPNRWLHFPSWEKTITRHGLKT